MKHLFTLMLTLRNRKALSGLVNKPKTYYLYHICRSFDKGDLTQGYIGISERHPEQRWKEHRKDKPWYNDFDDIIEYIVLETNSKREVYDKEMELRPVQGIGWNKASGGCPLPFNHPAAKYNRYGKD